MPTAGEQRLDATVCRRPPPAGPCQQRQQAPLSGARRRGTRPAALFGPPAVPRI